jgi:hypothetical protein
MGDGLITLLAVGDIALRNDDPQSQLANMKAVLSSGDITLGQMETALSNNGARQLFPGFRGRSGDIEKDARVGARILSDVGFTVMSLAGNHTLDRGATAMTDTIDAGDEIGLQVIGAGRDLASARRPAIVEVGGIRVGILANCSVTPKGFEAGPQKPGVAPLRARTFYEQVDWQPGTPARVISMTDPGDLAAMVEDIEKLRPEVDVIVVSCHWGIHFEPGAIADYQYEAAHAAIDAGADLVIGHHAHVVKGIEFYKGKPICYSIGNMTLLPRGDHGEPLGDHPLDAQWTMVLKCAISSDGISKLSIVPCWLDLRLEPEPLRPDDPRFDGFIAFMERVCALPSTPANAWEALYLPRNPSSEALRLTKFTRVGDEVVVSL